MKESGISIMLFEQIKLQGKSISEVSRETGISRNTIKKYLKEGEQPHKSKGKRVGSKLDSFKELIDHLLQLYAPHPGVRKLPELPVTDLPDIIASGNKSEQERTPRDGCS